MVFKNEPKQNVFAPEWNYFIFERYVENIDLKNLSKFILNRHWVV